MAETFTKQVLASSWNWTSCQLHRVTSGQTGQRSLCQADCWVSIDCRNHSWENLHRQVQFMLGCQFEQPQSQVGKPPLSSIVYTRLLVSTAKITNGTSLAVCVNTNNYSLCLAVRINSRISQGRAFTGRCSLCSVVSVNSRNLNCDSFHSQM